MVPPEMLTPQELDELMERAIQAADDAIERTPEGEEIIFDVCDVEERQ